MGTEDDINAAQALVRFNSAAAVLGSVVAIISLLDVWLVRTKRTSLSKHVGAFAREHPVLFRALIEAAVCHFMLELERDPLSWVATRIRREPCS